MNFSWLLHAYHSPIRERVPAHVRDTCMNSCQLKNVIFTSWLHVESVSELIMYPFRPQWYCKTRETRE